MVGLGNLFTFYLFIYSGCLFLELKIIVDLVLMFFSNIFNTKMKFENQIIGHPKGETADKRF